MPEEKQNPEPKFTVSFIKAKDYKLYPSTGVWAVPSADGTKIVLNFVVEHIAIPSYQTHEIHDKKINFVQVKDSVSSGEMEREFLCGVLLTLEDARSIGHFLVGKADEIDKQRKSS